MRRNGDPNKGGRSIVSGPCSIEGCDSPAYCRSLCHGHYKRMLEGRPLAGAIRERNIPTDTHKRCPSCGETKPLDAFARVKDKHSSWCKECHKHSRRRMFYGLSRDEYALLSANGCAVCGSLTNLVVDHHHGTGDVRGVLCSQCNVAIGMAADSPDRLLALAEYLRDPPHTPTAC